jgi:hypothetical protein
MAALVAASILTGRRDQRDCSLPVRQSKRVPRGKRDQIAMLKAAGSLVVEGAEGIEEAKWETA